MSTKQTSKNKSNHQKRMSKQTPKSIAAREQKEAEARAQQEKYDKKKHVGGSGVGKRVMAIFFSVVLILAFAVPSVAIFMQGDSASQSDKQYQAAIDLIQADLDEQPQEFILYLNKADYYFDWAMDVLQGQAESKYQASELFSLAAADYQSYLANANSSDAVNKLAQCYYYMGDYASAIQALQAQTQIDPTNATLWYQLGLVYSNDGNEADKQAAIDAYNKAIELDADGSLGIQAQATQQLSLLQGS